MKLLIDTLIKREELYFTGKQGFKWFFVLCFFIFLIIYLILGFLNVFVIKAEEFSAVATNNFSKTIIVPVSRGIIYDTNNVPLVTNIPEYLWVLDLNFLNRFKIYKNLESIFTKDEIEFLTSFDIKTDSLFLSEINKGLKLKKDYVILKSFGSKDEYINLDLQLFKTTLKNKSQIISNSIRSYRDGPIFSNILGYTQFVDEEILESDDFYDSFSKIGFSGLEKYYETDLRGKNSKEVRIYDALSKVYTKKSYFEGESGSSLITSIDFNLQKTAYDSLKKSVEKSKGVGGAVVVQNPQTGEILALVSYPAYDNNLFSNKISIKDYNLLLNDQTKPLINRAIQSTFPPGSVFKIVLAVGALYEKLITPDIYINDTGGVSVNNYFYKTWKSGGHGVINIIDALKYSSDTFFYCLGGGNSSFPQVKPLGVSKIYKWSRLFNFGSKLNIDLPSESEGLVPNEDWKLDVIKERWYLGNTYHLSIGQGYLLTTPLQINAMTSAIANNGKIMKPQIVKRVVNSSNTSQILKTFTPVILNDLELDSETLNSVKKGMVGAVNSGGTAYPLFNYKIPIAGKTGTSEFGKKENGISATHAWFTSFAPLDKPTISVTVFVEGGGEGSDAAVPVAKDVYDYYFKSVL
ncbi:penicillin-binding protein 2 [Patescibacteria group bacterium]|nr:penicillin-binding protein 2 [Patescibacteria group bacterium]